MFKYKTMLPILLFKLSPSELKNLQINKLYTCLCYNKNYINNCFVWFYPFVIWSKPTYKYKTPAGGRAQQQNKCPVTIFLLHENKFIFMVKEKQKT